jgi:hypothetical protein
LSINYAQDRSEARRDLVVREAAAIGTAWFRAKLMSGNEGAEIAKLIEEHAKIELALTDATPSNRIPSCLHAAASYKIGSGLWLKPFPGATRAELPESLPSR